MHLKVKRAYEPATPEDGFRILVDRLWPRGVSKERAKIDLWFKDASPSASLRKWFGHDPAKWEEFRLRYEAEVSRDALDRLQQLVSKHKVVTFVYAAKDEEHNEAVALVDMVGA